MVDPEGVALVDEGGGPAGEHVLETVGVRLGGRTRTMAVMGDQSSQAGVAAGPGGRVVHADLPAGLSEWAVHPGLGEAESQAIDS